MCKGLLFRRDNNLSRQGIRDRSGGIIKPANCFVNILKGTVIFMMNSL